MDIKEKFEPLVEAIDDTFTAEAVKYSAGNVYDALTGDDAAEYMDAGKEFEAALALFAAQTQRVMGSASRFAQAAREEAVKKGFLVVTVSEQKETAADQTDEDTIAKCIDSLDAAVQALRREIAKLPKTTAKTAEVKNDICPECKAAEEDNLPQEVRQNQEEARQEGSPKPVQKETEE